jgi:hypothetical protein
LEITWWTYIGDWQDRWGNLGSVGWEIVEGRGRNAQACVDGFCRRQASNVEITGDVHSKNRRVMTGSKADTVRYYQGVAPGGGWPKELDRNA